MKFNEKEMLDFAQKLAEKLLPGDILVLTGELGSGKTTFTKGIAKGLGIGQMVKSPTYTIVREYETGRLPLYHMDVYRIGDDPDSFDMDDYLFGEGVSVIEWGELLGQDLPESYLELLFDKFADSSDESRELRLVAHGTGYERFLA